MNKYKTINYSLPIDFDPILYKELNPDLEKLSNKEAINHYITQGILEHRIYNIVIPTDFDVNLYKKLNPDIQSLSNKNAITHYKIYGRVENRNYNIQLPFDFDVNLYKKLNTDMQNMSDDNAIIHYKLYGVSENRKYKINNTMMKNTIIENTIIKNKKNNIISFNTLENTNFINENNIKNIIECNNFVDINIINNLKSFTIIIDSNSNNNFLNTIVSHYKYKNTFLTVNSNNNILNLFINNDYIINKKYKEDEFILFLNENISKINKIFINNIINYSIEFINKLININIEITVMYNENIINYYTIILHKSKNIILQDKTNINIEEMLNIYFNSQLITSPTPYYNKIKEVINSNDNDIVNIGIINNDDIYHINNFIKYFKLNNKIKFFIIQFNNIYELNKLLIENKPQILITISNIIDYNIIKLILLINLPILYFTKSNSDNNNLSKYGKAYSYALNNKVEQLINTYKQNYFYTIEPNIYFNSFWNTYFTNNTKKKEYIEPTNYNRNKYDIKPYCVYFPQFHNFIENDIAFYKNFTDIQNLFLLSKNINSNIESPNLTEYNINNMIEYNLIDHNIIQKQIDIITLYNISGFAIYYYWFSINTITDKHMIMEKVINLFFDNKINMNDRKVFFIWANESWTQNPAFGNSNEKIENIYNEHYITLNVHNLLNYFKHNNYLKIDNKPVFMLHHPWFMTDIEIDLLYNILNYYCIQNSYDGVYFIINSMNGYYDGYLNYNFNFNYKKSTSCYYDKKISQTYLDYQQYINNDIEHNINNNSIINTLVFDFDNSARLYKPNRLYNSTICINNTELNKTIFINKIIETYKKNKKSDIENILLINGWNEWGEKMNIEPSSEYNFYYLNLLKKYI